MQLQTLQQKPALSRGYRFARLRDAGFAYCGINQVQGFLDDVESVLEFFLVDDKRRTNPKHVEPAERVHMLGLQMRG